jgi:regulator of RNase E activity RraA
LIRSSITLDIVNNLRRGQTVTVQCVDSNGWTVTVQCLDSNGWTVTVQCLDSNGWTVTVQMFVDEQF